MKLKVIIPIAGLSPEQVNQKVEYLKQFLPEEVTLEGTCLSEGPNALMNEVDTARAVPYLIEAVKASLKYDGIFIDCFDDPGLRALRELTSIPIVGAFEASLNACSHIMDEVIIISPDKEAIPSTRHKVMNSRFKEIVKDIVALDTTDYTKEGEHLRKLVQSIQLDKDIDGVILGCTAFYEYMTILKSLDIQVIDPSALAILDLYRLCAVQLQNGQHTYPNMI